MALRRSGVRIPMAPLPRLPENKKKRALARLLPLRLFLSWSLHPPFHFQTFPLSYSASLIYLKFDRSEFITKGSLRWSQEGFDQRPFSADRHGREALEPRPNGHFRIGVEPRCQRLDSVGSNAALMDTQHEVFEERSWDVPALNLWHYEPE